MRLVVLCLMPGEAAAADYFSVFQLPRKLGLDVRALEKAFYARSREVHPDRFARAGGEQQKWSLEQTSLLNDAYRTLKDPIARTEYLLRREGVTIADEKSPAKTPPDLLEEVFELNMQMEEMRIGDDDPQLRADLQRARAQFEEQFAALGSEIERAGAEWDGALESGDRTIAQESLTRMAALLDKRRYVRNLVRDVREALGS